jgi:hypothetical protein
MRISGIQIISSLKNDRHETNRINNQDVLSLEVALMNKEY